MRWRLRCRGEAGELAPATVPGSTVPGATVPVVVAAKSAPAAFEACWIRDLVKLAVPVAAVAVASVAAIDVVAADGRQWLREDCPPTTTRQTARPSPSQPHRRHRCFGFQQLPALEDRAASGCRASPDVETLASGRVSVLSGGLRKDGGVRCDRGGGVCGRSQGARKNTLKLRSSSKKRMPMMGGRGRWKAIQNQPAHAE